MRRPSRDDPGAERSRPRDQPRRSPPGPRDERSGRPAAARRRRARRRPGTRRPRRRQATAATVKKSQSQRRKAPPVQKKRAGKSVARTSRRRCAARIAERPDEQRRHRREEERIDQGEQADLAVARGGPRLASSEPAIFQTGVALKPWSANISSQRPGLSRARNQATSWRKTRQRSAVKRRAALRVGEQVADVIELVGAQVADRAPLGVRGGDSAVSRFRVASATARSRRGRRRRARGSTSRRGSSGRCPSRG